MWSIGGIINLELDIWAGIDFMRLVGDWMRIGLSEVTSFAYNSSICSYSQLEYIFFLFLLRAI
jgi:hypothetical protein